MKKEADQIQVLVDKFVDDVAELARRMALGALEAVLKGSADSGKPINAGNFDPALDTQPAIAKAAKAATKAAKKIAKRTVKKVRSKVAKANKEASRNIKSRQKDAKRAFYFRQKVKEGKPITDENAKWLAKYNKKHPSVHGIGG